MAFSARAYENDIQYLLLEDIIFSLRHRVDDGMRRSRGGLRLHARPCPQEVRDRLVSQVAGAI